MATTPASKLSMAARAASTLVAFESFTNRTPATSVTGSITCASPANPRNAAVIGPDGTPATAPIAHAATASASM
jgi:hypothetical protein